MRPTHRKASSADLRVFFQWYSVKQGTLPGTVASFVKTCYIVRQQIKKKIKIKESVGCYNLLLTNPQLQHIMHDWNFRRLSETPNAKGQG